MSMSTVQRLCDRAMIVAVVMCRCAIGAAIAGIVGVASSAVSVLKKKRLFMSERWCCNDPAETGKAAKFSPCG